MRNYFTSDIAEITMRITKDSRTPALGERDRHCLLAARNSRTRAAVQRTTLVLLHYFVHLVLSCGGCYLLSFCAARRTCFAFRHIVCLFCVWSKLI
jgi:hypothetical protein